MPNKSKYLFLNLYAYSLTGGVEKVSKNFVDALQQLFGHNNWQANSLHDKPADAPNLSNYKAYAGSKIAFMAQSISQAFSFNTIILAHINLLLVAKLMAIVRPKNQFILFAHGIEVWKPLSPWKINFLKKHVKIWAVSEFTKAKMISLYGIAEQQITVLNNSLPQQLQLANNFEKPSHLSQKYQLNAQQATVFTLNRLSSAERYKGYDNVIKAIAGLKKEGISICYLLAGKADEKEQQRLTTLIAAEDVQQEVKLIGYIPAQQLQDHFLLADVFAMPSTGEGFGVVFIEAAAQGCQIIGGNADGSTDALLQGQLGQMVNPNSVQEIATAIKTALNNTSHQPLQQQQLALINFGFNAYCQKVKALLTNNQTNALPH